jgi:hypothetical protein
MTTAPPNPNGTRRRRKADGESCREQRPQARPVNPDGIPAELPGGLAVGASARWPRHATTTLPLVHRQPWPKGRKGGPEGTHRFFSAQ